MGISDYNLSAYRMMALSIKFFTTKKLNHQVLLPYLLHAAFILTGSEPQSRPASNYLKFRYSDLIDFQVQGSNRHLVFQNSIQFWRSQDSDATDFCNSLQIPLQSIICIIRMCTKYDVLLLERNTRFS